MNDLGQTLVQETRLGNSVCLFKVWLKFEFICKTKYPQIGLSKIETRNIHKSSVVNVVIGLNYLIINTDTRMFSNFVCAPNYLHPFWFCNSLNFKVENLKLLKKCARFFSFSDSHWEEGTARSQIHHRRHTKRSFFPWTWALLFADRIINTVNNGHPCSLILVLTESESGSYQFIPQSSAGMHFLKFNPFCVYFIPLI